MTVQLALSLDPNAKQHQLPESVLNQRGAMVGPALVREWRVSEREFINIKIQRAGDSYSFGSWIAENCRPLGWDASPIENSFESFDDCMTGAMDSVSSLIADGVECKPCGGWSLEFMQKLDAIFRRGQFVERIVGDCDE